LAIVTFGDIHIYEYALPFQNPITMMRQQFTERRGLVLSIKNKDGCEGLGEIAPFPGLSKESLLQAKNQLLKLIPAILKKNISLFGDVKSISAKASLPSVRFGIESAICDLWAKSQHRQVAQLFTKNPLEKIKINALLADANDAVYKTKQIATDNFSAIKIKVGRGDIDQEIEMVQSARKNVGRYIAIRLDANCAWTLNEAIRFARGVQECDIEYIEEPLVHAHQIQEFVAATSLPVALDESLTLETSSDPPDGVVAFIIKPGIDGGVFDVIKFIKQANFLNIKPVLSSPFLSAIGLNMALQIASAHVPASSVMGFGTFKFFKADFVKTPVRIENGELDVQEFNNNVSLNKSLLNEC
jgi:o-succinylbenzoate synthase